MLRGKLKKPRFCHKLIEEEFDVGKLSKKEYKMNDNSHRLCYNLV